MGEWTFDKCPKTFVTDSMEDWFLGYKMFKNGFLPNDGGYLSQSNKFIKMMIFIDNQLDIHRQETADKNGRK